MRKWISLAGKWEAELADGSRYPVTLPGTLDTNGIGHEDRPAGKLYQDENYVENASLAGADVIATRFTRKHTYEGKAVFSRIWEEALPQDRRLFLKVERARVLMLSVDHKKVPALRGSLSTPYVFEVTGLVNPGSVIEITSDNSYEGLPHDNIVYSSAATDETQTNWNGLIGEIGIEIREKTLIERVRIYPHRRKGTDHWRFRVETEIDSAEGFAGTLALKLLEPEVREELRVEIGPGKSCVSAEMEAEVPEELLWDEFRGRLVRGKAELIPEDRGEDPAGLSGDRREECEVTFGIRSFDNNSCYFNQSVKDNGRYLCLNGRRIFLRSETNCAVFPETGHPPMEAAAWREILSTYLTYGVNSLRFHSHCPPEAAFVAADELGVLLQPELSHWNPVDAFSDPAAAAYYRKELTEILAEYADHPSFVMLTFGNELQAREDGRQVAKNLLDLCHERDQTRLFAFSSNAFYGEQGADPESDFYTAMRYRGLPMRATFDGMKGYLNADYPDARHDYSETVSAIRESFSKPVFSFEVGQYEILPDFREIGEFHGVTEPRNLERIRENVIRKGLLKVGTLSGPSDASKPAGSPAQSAEAVNDWEKRVEASGELSLLCYREEVEAALRTEGYSGISLLGLQDFPGQGTALVGMLNSHLKAKPYPFAEPERFRSFFTDVLPLLYLTKYTYVESEGLAADVKLANYSGRDVKGRLSVELKDGEQVLFAREAGEEVLCRQGGLSPAGRVEIAPEIWRSDRNRMLTLTVSFAGYRNTCRIWVYTESSQHPVRPEEVYETGSFDGEVRRVLEAGGIVFYVPDPEGEDFPDSIRSTFSTDFWSVGTFASQEGSMGLLIDEEHPLFADYPTRFHTDHQWFVQSSQRALILPEGVKSIVTVLDSYAYLRNMGMLLEFRCLRGRVFVSSLGQIGRTEYPECRALLSSIYRYLASDAFEPEQVISYEDWVKMTTPGSDRQIPAL